MLVMVMRLVRRIVRIGRVAWLGAAAVACSRQEQPPPDRPSQPTLTVGVDAGAPTTGRRVVAVGQIAQPWHTGAWAPASITLSDVAAGDAIVVLGAFWGDLEAFSSTVPTDSKGSLQPIVHQGTDVVGRVKPPVFAQLFVELDAAPGAHTIVPPYLGGAAGDGTFYVVQIRGLTEHRVVSHGDRRQTSAAQTGISADTGAPAGDGDLVIAIAGFDDTSPHTPAGWSHPPAGWIALGVQQDGANNVPSELCYRLAPAGSTSPAVAWTWNDPSVNIAVAAIATLR